MLVSQVSSQESERIKKRFYIGGEDEYNCSSDPLNGWFVETGYRPRIGGGSCNRRGVAFH